MTASSGLQSRVSEIDSVALANHGHLTLGDRRVAGWLRAVDPAAIRRRHGTRAVGAAVSTWVSLRLVGRLPPDGVPASVPVYGVVVCLVASLVIVDPIPRERFRTLALAIIVVGTAVTVASLVHGHAFVYSIILLALTFLSFVARRGGLRWGELGLIAATGLYFADNVGVRGEFVGWYLLACAVGIAWLATWTFVVVPHRPEASLAAAVQSFRREASELVDDVERAIAAHVDATSSRPPDVRRSLRRVEVTRSVIESQFPGALAPQRWTPARLARLQLALHTTERGLAQLVTGVERAREVALPTVVAETLSPVLRAVSGAMHPRSVADSALVDELAVLRAETQRVAAGWVERGRADATPAPWVMAAIPLARGTREVARSIGDIDAVYSPAVVDDHGATVLSAGPSTAVRPPRIRVFGGVVVHPTTALGIQALCATGVAMLVARMLRVEHPNWVFWSAFVVIAGSTDESVRRMMTRVAGTVGGAVVGVVVIAAVGDVALGAVAAAIAGTFFAVYFTPVSYPLTVFSLNVAFVAVVAELGAPTRQLLVERPLTTLLGALIAALVALTVLPIRISDRYGVQLAALLDDVASTVDRWVDVATSRGERDAAERASLRTQTSYQHVLRLLPGVAFELNPLVQARAPLASQTTEVAAVMSALHGLELEAADHVPDDADDTRLIDAVCSRLHDEIDSLRMVLTDAPAPGSPTLPPASAVDARSLSMLAEEIVAAPDARGRGRILQAMLALHDSVGSLAQSNGVQSGQLLLTGDADHHDEIRRDA
jgi:hypothetical protein